MANIRKSKGTMLALVAVTLGVIVAIGVLGIIYNTFLCQHSRAQYKVDALAVMLANCINADDRVGQMNELEERSRELIYVSRQVADECSRQRSQSFLTPLCDQLVDEAREGQTQVEDERRNQIHIICRNIQDAARMYNRHRDENSTIALRWLQTYEPQIMRVDVGQITNMQSNTKSLQIIPQLAQFDDAGGYIDRQTRLFKGAANVRLPSPDTDLNFRFSPLPALVGKTAAPPRNTNPDVFLNYGSVFANATEVNYSLKHTPNAVQISCSMDVSFGSNPPNRNSVNLMSTATTSGALVETE